MSSPDLSIEWYFVTSSGEQAGPVNIDELRNQYQNKQTHNECLCWNESLEGWTLIKDVPNLLTYLTLKGPPPLPKTPTISIALPTVQSQAQTPSSPTASPLPAESPSSSTSASLGRPQSPSPSPSSATSTVAGLSRTSTTPISNGATSSSSTAAKTKKHMIETNKAKYKTLKKDRVNAGTLPSKNSSIQELISKTHNKAKTLKPSSTSSSGNHSEHQQGTVTPIEDSHSPSLPHSTSTSNIDANNNNAHTLPESTTASAAVSQTPSRSASDAAALVDSVHTAVASSSPVPVRTALNSALPSDPVAAAQHISKQLIHAVTTLDMEAISYWITQGDTLQIDENHYVISPLARMYLSKVIEARRLMNEAVSPINEQNLLVAVYYAEALGYDRSDVQACRKLRDTIIQLNLEAKQQLLILDDKKSRQILARAEAIGYTTHPAMEQLRTYMCSTSEEKLRQAQLKAANAMSDRHRSIRLTIALKDLVFKKQGHLFNVDSYGKWRNADEWANEKLMTLHHNELAEGMKKYNKEPIHMSLSILNKEQNKQAIRLFKKILTFAGDREKDRSHDPSATYMIVYDILNTGLTEPALRDEIYLQLMKQLTGNPNHENEMKIWQIFYGCLETFPPNSEMENIVEMFLNKHIIQGSVGVRMLHGTVYEGERRCVPSESEMSVIMSGKSIRHCAFEEEKEVKPVKAVLPARATVQKLAGTTAASIAEFIESGMIPDWTQIELTIPTGEELMTQLQALQPSLLPTPVTNNSSASTNSTKGAKPAVQVSSPVSVSVPASLPTSPLSTVAALNAKVPLFNFPHNNNNNNNNNNTNGVSAGSTTSSVAGSRNVSVPATPRGKNDKSPIMLSSALSPKSGVSIPSSLVSDNSNDIYAAVAAVAAASPVVAPAPVPVPVTLPVIVTPIIVPPPVVEPVPPPPPAAAAQWGKAIDPATNNPYYYNLTTHEVTWDRPADYHE